LQRTNAELEQRVKVRTADLLHMNTELEYANRAKDEFLANMSHELRTPLTNILGLAESMQLSTYGEPNEKQVKALQNIESSGRHLLELINDILDLSKIEAGKFDIYPEEVNIDEICRASLLFIREQAQKKSIMVNYQLLEDVKTVLADPRRLKQILVNLLSNAVKFTPDNGRVTLTVHADAEHGQMHFSVIDSGIGIAQEDLSRLFTPFTQVDSSLNRQYEGTGLGLVLVFRLAEMHRGSVHVESEAGRGSSFTVSLPWLPLGTDQRKTPGADAQVESRAVQPPNSLGTLLLVDDNLANIEAIGDYLQYHGYTVVVASNGLEALVKAEESNPRLILMDIQMPVMDGLESMRRLRADPRFIITPIIALTALAMSGDRERCLEAGATDYLSKPVRLKELAERVKSLLK
jgi:CheY-like chemotaxis protein/nitrogen-specific signal transduction histidine kinase